MLFTISPSQINTHTPFTCFSVIASNEIRWIQWKHKFRENPNVVASVSKETAPFCRGGGQVVSQLSVLEQSGHLSRNNNLSIIIHHLGN